MIKIKEMLSNISPVLLAKILYYKNFGKRLNLKNPRNINEKLQYLKFNDYNNNPIITECVDKYKVREYLKRKKLAHLCPRLYGVYKSVDDIMWQELPNKFVIKCNHGSGMNIICLDKSNINIEDLKKQLKKWMKFDFWKVYGEVQYKNIEKRIIIEELLAEDILTYKFYCFNGKVKASYVSLNGENGEKEKYIDFFDKEWNRLEISLGEHEHYPGKILKPKGYEKMIELAGLLSKDFPFVRVDLYNVDGKIYFSELTFIPTGAMMKLEPNSILEEWGEYLDLSK